MKVWIKTKQLLNCSDRWNVFKLLCVSVPWVARILISTWIRTRFCRIAWAERCREAEWVGHAEQNQAQRFRRTLMSECSFLWGWDLLNYLKCSDDGKPFNNSWMHSTGCRVTPAPANPNRRLGKIDDYHHNHACVMLRAKFSHQGTRMQLLEKLHTFIDVQEGGAMHEELGRVNFWTGRCM